MIEYAGFSSVVEPAIDITASSPYLKNVTIRNNQGDGINAALDNAEFRVEDCSIFDNGDYGIYILNSAGCNRFYFFSYIS